MSADASGGSMSGVRAASPRAFLGAVREEAVARVSRGARSLGSALESVSRVRLSVRERVVFIKRLSFLIKANVPILESLRVLEEQGASPRSRRVVAAIAHDVESGQSLARSLARFPNIFGAMSVNIVKVGESSGTLSRSLDYLAEELKKRYQLRRKVVGASVYPAVITAASVAIAAFLVLFLFPKIMPVLLSLQVTLPQTTQALIAITTFLTAWGLSLLGGMLGAVVLLLMLLRTSELFHAVFDAVILRLPLAGRIIRSYNLANLSRTLGLLLGSGLTLSHALPLAAEATKNLIYQRELHAAAALVMRGGRVSSHFAKRRFLFPDIATHLIGVGERTGNLSNAFQYLAELYEAEVDDFTKNLSALVEPLLMILMGVVVGFIAIAIITPLYDITQHIRP